MKLRKVEWYDIPWEKLVGPRGIQGPKGEKGEPGNPGPRGEKGDTNVVDKVIERIIEKPAQDTTVLQLVDNLSKEISKLKKANTGTFVGGSNPTNYIIMTEQEMHFRKPSFSNGITVIGVRYSGAATVYLPHDLDPTMLVAIKDETGSGNITVLVE